MALSAEKDRLLTLAEVAALFSVGEDTALRWGRKRRLGSVRTPGGQWRFPESAVRSFLDQHSTGAIPDA